VDCFVARNAKIPFGLSGELVTQDGDAQNRAARLKVLLQLLRRRRKINLEHTRQHIGNSDSSVDMD
jgi:hypothetical protein